MVNRFERLFQLPERQYIKGSPVILTAGVLSKDTETGNIIAQLKFQSVSEKQIKAVKVSLSAYDVSKAEVHGVTDYQYLELDVGNGQEFGSNKAIVMPISVTRSFVVSSMLVVFADGSMWESTGDFTVLPTAKELSLGGAELEKQYRIATSDSATYTPAEYQGLWQCVCGTWNKSATCTRCRLIKSNVFSALDLDTLTEQMNARHAKEQAQREAEKARQAELHAQAEARKTKIRKVAATVSVPIVIAIVLYVLFTVLNNAIIIPNSKYNDAITLMDAEKYSEAISVFEELDGYRNSHDKIAECNTAILDGKYSEAISLMDAGKYTEAIVTFKALNGYKDSQDKINECNVVVSDRKYNEAIALMENEKYIEAMAAFMALNGYKDSQDKISECNIVISDRKYNEAKVLAEAGEKMQAIMLFNEIADYNDAREQSTILLEEITVRETISAGDCHSAGLRFDGTVVVAGDDSDGQCDTSDWTDIIAVSAGGYHTVGLRENGTVVATKYTGTLPVDYGQCNVSRWTNIVAISAGRYHTVGLRANGTVVAVGSVNGVVSCWTDIVAISAGDHHTVGLRADGTVVAVGDKFSGECNVSDWTGIVAISAGGYHTVGLRADGTVVATKYFGNYYHGQCDVSNWANIVAISAGDHHTVGLRADGTVVAVGENYSGECNVSDWTNIVAISAGQYHTLGLCADGTVVAVGSNVWGLCDMSDWKDIKLP